MKIIYVKKIGEKAKNMRNMRNMRYTDHNMRYKCATHALQP